MNKFIKILLIILGILVLALAVMYIIGPEKYKITRGILIQADRETVWNQINLWENHKNWSPWVAKEKDMPIKIEGEDGTVGSKYSWDSKTQGAGYQEIIQSKPMELRVAELNFTGWGSSRTAFMLSDSAGGTWLEWNMYGENGFLGRVMQSVFNFEKMMAPDYEAGLANIKKVCESAAKPAAYRIGEIEVNDFKATIFVGIRREMDMDEFNKNGNELFGKAAGEIMTYVGKNKLQVTGPMSSLYYIWDEKGRRVDFAVCFPVDKESKPEGNIKVIKIPAAEAATVDVTGDYSGLGVAHTNIDKWLQKNSRESLSPVMEEYVTDPSAVPDKSKWLTRVWYLLK